MRPSLPLIAVAAALLATTLARADTRHAINLPAGALGDSIVALSRITGASIRLADAGLWQRPAPAIHGTLTVREALRRVAAPSDAQPVPLGPQSWQIASRAATPARAHDTPPAAAAIVVSASKRGTRFAKFPGTATILSGTDMPGGGPADSDSIASRAASVTSTHLGAGRDKLFIRGVADSGLVGQSQATVGEYWGDLRLTYNAPDPDLKLYDIAAIEVLEGPQGTLYGAGSPGGIIRVVRRDAVLGRFEGSATAGVSTVAHGAVGGDGSAMLNLPLGDRAALRVVGYASSDGGYIDNSTTGERNINRVHTEGGRAVLRVAPGDGWTIDAGATVQDIHGDDSQYADRDAPPLTRRSAVAQPYEDDYRLGELTIAKDWGGLRFTSSSAIVRQQVDERFDATFAPVFPRLLDQHNHTAMVTSESRLSRPVTDGFGWVVGTSYLHNSARLTRALGPLDQSAPTTGVLNHIDETTLFGEFSVAPLRGLTITAGGRLTHSRLSGRALDPAGGLFATALNDDDGKRSETKFLPSIAASTEPGHGVILFVRYQQGFRPGGLAIGNAMIRRFQSDRVATMEAGVRYDRPGDDAISLSASVAYTDWRNIQADFLDAQGLPVTTNIGDGRIWSFDARAAWRPIPSLRLEGSVIVNNSRLTRPNETQLFQVRQDASVLFAQQKALQTTTAPALDPIAIEDIERSQLPNVAELGGRIGVDYHHSFASGIDLSVGGWARYIGKSRLGVGPILGGTEGDYVDTGLSARIGRKRTGVTLSLSNLLDTAGNRFALGTPLNVVRNSDVTPLQPRTIRLGFDTHF
ncbi:MAG TPA: TonB-dependent receptor [Sphingomonas sp.]|nr:TonB-dependent receptor [Sphingomonas sp.]